MNDAPVAADDALATTHNTLVEVRLADLVANDTDVDDVALAVINVTQPAHGTLVDNGDGTLSYRPDVGFTGADSFTYTVADGNGAVDTAVVTVNVSSQVINNPPPDDEPPADTGEDDSPATESDPPPEVIIETVTDTEGSGDSANRSVARGPYVRNHASATQRESVPAAIRPAEEDPLLSLDSVNADTSVTHNTVAGGGFRTFARQVNKAASHVTNLAQITLDVGSLWEQLDVFREDVAVDSQGFTAGVVTVTGTLSLLTAGYATWTIRGGYLLSSVLTSLPAWRMVDPLPILAAPSDPRKKHGQHSEDDPDESDPLLTRSDDGPCRCRLVRSKPTASGRVTLVGSAGPA